jgi:hypothetical protein
MGARYTDDSWSQRLIGGHAFLDALSRNEAVYLAQHNLLDQIPSLADDVCIPDYAALGSGEHEAELLVWLGPRSTVSPCHYDPYHNLLCQVVGWKCVRLFAPEHSAALQPHPTTLLSNTSQLDIEHTDADTLPPSRVCVLGPGAPSPMLP